MRDCSASTRVASWSADISRLKNATLAPIRRLKVNPLGDWVKADLEAYFAEYDLPRHPLEADGYPSIGCQPCTSKVLPGEDPRAGRWRGWEKTECGIHVPEKPGEEPVF